MRISILYFYLFTCSFILFLSSCDTTEPPLNRDTSLAGSVSMGSRQIKKCKGTFGENSIENFQSNASVLVTGKISDEEITLYCITKWSNESIEISFPLIPLSGESYNVNFDYSATNAKVKYNTTEWQIVSASINGWIKRVGFDDTQNVIRSNKNVGDPAIFLYACDINISCFLDGRKLILNISSIAP